MGCDAQFGRQAAVFRRKPLRSSSGLQSVGSSVMFISPCQTTRCHIPQNRTGSVYFIILCILLRQVLSIDSRLVRSHFSFLDLKTEKETFSETPVCQNAVFWSLSKLYSECYGNMNNKLQNDRCVRLIIVCFSYQMFIYFLSFSQTHKVCAQKSTENILRRYARCHLRMSVLSPCSVTVPCVCQCCYPVLSLSIAPVSAVTLQCHCPLRLPVLSPCSVTVRCVCQCYHPVVSLSLESVSAVILQCHCPFHLSVLSPCSVTVHCVCQCCHLEYLCKSKLLVSKHVT